MFFATTLGRPRVHGLAVLETYSQLIYKTTSVLQKVLFHLVSNKMKVKKSCENLYRRGTNACENNEFMFNLTINVIKN